MNVNDLKVRHGEVRERMTAIADAAEADNRNLNEDEGTEFAALKTEAADLRARIERIDTLAADSGFTPAEVAPDADPSIGMSAAEVREYSILRAVRASVDGDWSQAGLEREASEAARNDESRGTFTIPHDVLTEKRDLTVGTATGDQLVSTDLHPESFIDLLRNRMVVQAAGATVIPGLVGDFAVPKADTGVTAYWVTEDGAPSESTSAFTQVTMSPKTVAAYEDISRKMLQQGTPAADNLIRNDLAKTLALAIDLAALHGTGASYQPTGIAATSGIGSVAGGANGLAPAWSHLVNLETEIAQDNADIGSMAYITSAKVRGKMKQTAKVSSTDSFMLWDGGGSPLNGYPAFVSNQVSDVLTKGTSTAKCSAIFFGVWEQLIIGFWGGLDILVNPYILSTTGQVRIQAFQSCDICVRYPQAFSAMLDALTA